MMVGKGQEAGKCSWLRQETGSSGGSSGYGGSNGYGGGGGGDGDGGGFCNVGGDGGYWREGEGGCRQVG